MLRRTNLQINSLIFMHRGGPAPFFSTFCHKTRIRMFATSTFLILKTNISIYSNYNKRSFLKTNSHVKIHKIKIYIILLAVQDLFKNVLEYVMHIEELR